MRSLTLVVKNTLFDIDDFTRMNTGIALRPYQLQAARLIVNSIIHSLGHSFAIVFPRQSGKNELQAQIEAYLLAIFSTIDGEIVKVSPTMTPQTINAMHRLQRVLTRCAVSQDRWYKEADHIYQLDTARITFLSGHSESHVVGATASTLLECDEAQDVPIDKWDKEFAPMAASTNATCVFYGTAWTSHTLLAREYRRAVQAQQEDGCRRAFFLTASDVAAFVPSYGKYVEEQVKKLGRSDPFIKTQYFSEEIDSEVGLFPSARLALMRGDHPCEDGPRPGAIYALALDVAGEDEALEDDPAVKPLKNPARDSTALSIFSIDLSTLEDELLRAPTYRLVRRFQWVGVKHTRLYAQIKALVEHWGAKYLVVDATGVGAGLASFLSKACPGVVIPFIFTLKSKSDLAWKFLAVIETGRYKEFDPITSCPPPSFSPPLQGEGLGVRSGGVSRGTRGVSRATRDRSFSPPLVGDKSRGTREGLGVRSDPTGLSAQVNLQETFFSQAQYCQGAVLEGPGKLLRWGVPDGTRHPASSELLHDDLLVSAALCAVLDSCTWGIGLSQVIQGIDPLAEFDEVF